MKIQLAYKFSGENPEKTKDELRKIKTILERNHQVYCPCLDVDQPKEPKKMFESTFLHMKEADALLILLKSNEKSEGMLIETGVAIALNKKIFLAIQKDITSPRLTALSNKIIKFKNLEELYNKIENI